MSSVTEAIVQAIRLAILTIGYALEQARKHEQLVEAALERRTLFERALVLALERMRVDTGEDNRKAEALDSKIDDESKKR